MLWKVDEGRTRITGDLKFLNINNGIKLRKEYFGGIAFDTNKGTMIDLDIEAFNMLELIQKNPLIYLI